MVKNENMKNVAALKINSKIQTLDPQKISNKTKHC